MRNCVILLFLVVAFLSPLVGQDSKQEGFDYLETGEFEKAKLFFENYLENVDSTDLTAKLCYGRSLGLTGDITSAQTIFRDLINTSPDNLEFRVNYAESQILAKNYSEAKEMYEGLMEKDSTQLAISLGYANVLSLSKLHKQAYEQIEKARSRFPDNAGVLNSYKFIHLAYADDLIRRNSLDTASLVVQENLDLFPNEVQSTTLLMNILTLQKKYKASIAAAKSIANSPDLPVGYYSLFAYTYFLNGNVPKAIAVTNKLQDKYEEGSEDYLQAQLAIATSLGWKEKYIEAYETLNQLDQFYPLNPQIIARKGMLSVWQGKYKQAENLYSSALDLDSSNLDALLGMADAKIAQNKDEEAENYLRLAEDIQPNILNARLLQEKIDRKHAVKSELVYFSSMDLGGNNADQINALLEMDLTKKGRIGLSLENRDIINELLLHDQSIRNAMLSLSWMLHSNWFIIGKIGVLDASVGFTKPIFSIHNNFRLGHTTKLSLGYESGVQDFTADLIEKQSEFDDFYLTLVQKLPYKLGLYGDGHVTNYSDGNKRQLLFLSLYMDVMKKPAAKVGLNYNTMSFQEQVPELYFSPSSYNSKEGFVLLDNREILDQKVLYHFLGAYGIQKIEEEASQSMYRFELGLGYAINNKLQILAHYKNSNSSTTTVAGYKYEEVGISATYLFY